MPSPPHKQAESLQTDYASLRAEAYALLQDERDFIANSANFAALIYHGIPEVNWSGFYFTQGLDLVLGPFCGKPACSRIAFGEGVCGKAAAGRQTLTVDDVGAFPGHIACDTASRSEIVVPLLRRDEILGVFDIDSALPARFAPEDKLGIERLVQLFVTITSEERPLIDEQI